MLISTCNLWLLLQILLWSFWEICHSWLLYYILFLAVCLSSLTHPNCWQLHPFLRCTILLVVFPTKRHSRLLRLCWIITRQTLLLLSFQLTRSSWKSKSYLVVNYLYSNFLWQVLWSSPLESKTQILGIQVQEASYSWGRTGLKLVVSFLFNFPFWYIHWFCFSLDRTLILPFGLSLLSLFKLLNSLPILVPST